MARGGPGRGQGRPKGSRNRKLIEKEEEEAVAIERQQSVPGLPAENLTPLEYMLKVINDPAASKDRRDRMATVAAPFCHGKPGEKGGKKIERDDAARKVAVGRFSPALAPKVVNIK